MKVKQEETVAVSVSNSKTPFRHVGNRAIWIAGPWSARTVVNEYEDASVPRG